MIRSIQHELSLLEKSISVHFEHIQRIINHRMKDLPSIRAYPWIRLKISVSIAQLGKGGFVGALDFPESTQLSEDKLLKVCKDRYYTNFLSFIIKSII